MRPPLRPLHPASSFGQPKLDEFARMTTEQLIKSLEPGRPGSLKVREDGTIIDAAVPEDLDAMMSIDVDALPREIVT